MHTKDNYIKIFYSKLRYSIQIKIDNKYIIAADIFSDQNDIWMLIPFLKTMATKLGFKYSSTITDSRYDSKEGYEFSKESKQVPYI